MAKSANSAPKAGAKVFTMDVLPSGEDLNDALAANGQCDPKNCWHYMAISKILERWAPGERHVVKVDAGHIKCNYRGWHYMSDAPRHVKRSLMLFDAGRYEEVHTRKYRLRFRRVRKIVKATADRKAQINRARTARIAAGSDEPKRKYPNLRARVEGFSGIV
jgi:hypothetical protein